MHAAKIRAEEISVPVEEEAFAVEEATNNGADLLLSTAQEVVRIELRDALPQEGPAGETFAKSTN